VPSEFADTVQGEPEPRPLAEPAGASLPATDSDIGLEFGAESDSAVAEKPTLSHIGRYALKSLLGEGGLGRVYEAWDPLLSRTVAVKTLQFDLDMPSRIALDRLLLNEARAAANLGHAHIVTVYDAGLSSHGVYIAMERLRGRDLRQMLNDGWRPSPEAAAQIVRRVADALAYAHARGVVHCDIKPGNIFLTRKDKPKVLDFGIARAAHASVPVHGEALIAGSPYYIAPEQLDSGTIDARTDIYSLGVVLYELLASQKAFRGEQLEDIQAAVRAGQAVPLRELKPELSPALIDVVERAMALDPAQRYASASELSSALRHWGAVTPAAKMASTLAATPARRPRTLVLAGVAAVAALGLMAAALTREDAAESPAHDLAQAPAAAATVAAPTASVTTPAAAETTLPTAAATAAANTNATPPVAAPRPAAKPRPAPAVAETKPAAAPALGTLQLAISPWGEVEVDGKSAGTTPPLTQLSLSEGTHTVTVRNADFPPYTATVKVQADKPATVRHRFGS
jgi:eukaryotic-like serine/threonine-protein kinase